MPNPLKLRLHANGSYNDGVQVTTNAELDYLVKKLLINYATESGSGDNTGDLNIDSTGTSVGTFTDNFANAELGSHPYNLAHNQSTTYTFKQNTATASETSIHPLITIDSPSNNGHVRVVTDAELNAVMDLALADIAKANTTAAGTGTYYLSINAPSISGTWVAQDNFYDEVTNHANDDDQKVTYKLWRKTSYDNSPNDISLLKQVSGNIKVQTDAELLHMTSRLRNRIIATGKGTYKFQASAPGTGTWVVRGEASDRTPQLSNVQYTGTFANQYTGQFAREFTREFTAQYTRAQYARQFANQFQRIFSAQYSVAFARGYTSSYSRGVVGTQYAGPQYARARVESYTRQFARTFSGQYSTFYNRVFSAQYSEVYSNQFQRKFARGDTYAASYSGTYGRGITYAVSYLLIYYGNYSVQYARQYTRQYQRVYNQGYNVSYTRQYQRQAPGQNYTGAYASPNYQPYWQRTEANGHDGPIYIRGVYSRGPVPSTNYDGPNYAISYQRQTQGPLYNGPQYDGTQYGRSFARTRLGQDYARNFYARRYSGSRSYGAYARLFNGPQYTGSFIRNQFSRLTPGPTYEGTRFARARGGPQYNGPSYSVTFTGQYTRQFTRQFVGAYTRTFARNVTFSRQFTRARPGPQYTGQFTRAQYTGQFARNTTGPEYATQYSQQFAGSRTQQFTGATIQSSYTTTTKKLWLRVA